MIIGPQVNIVKRGGGRDFSIVMVAVVFDTYVRFGRTIVRASAFQWDRGFALRTHDTRVKESRGFFDVYSRFSPACKECWQGGLGFIAPIADHSTAAVHRDQARVIRWHEPEAHLESLRFDQVELRPSQFHLTLSCEIRMIGTPPLTNLHARKSKIETLPKFIYF
jgi:hypothetical protein